MPGGLAPRDGARPVPTRPDETQEYWLTLRAEAQLRRDQAEVHGQDVTDLDALITELDTEIARIGVRGKVTSGGKSSDGKSPPRRSRSTRRRQDAAPLPRRKVDARTIADIRGHRDVTTFSASTVTGCAR